MSAFAWSAYWFASSILLAAFASSYFLTSSPNSSDADLYSLKDAVAVSYALFAIVAAGFTFSLAYVSASVLRTFPCSINDLAVLSASVCRSVNFLAWSKNDCFALFTESLNGCIVSFKDLVNPLATSVFFNAVPASFKLVRTILLTSAVLNI